MAGVPTATEFAPPNWETAGAKMAPSSMRTAASLECGSAS